MSNAISSYIPAYNNEGPCEFRNAA